MASSRSRNPRPCYGTGHRGRHEFDRGYLWPYFVSDAEHMECVFEDPYILIHDKKINNMKDLLPILEQTARQASRCW